jgi:hypothetical protein
MRRFHHTRLGVIVLAALLVADARADSFSLQPHISTGIQDYKLTFLDAISASARSNIKFRQGFSVRDRLPFVGAGLTGSYQNFFVDLSGQWSGTGRDQTHQVQGNFIPGVNIVSAGVGHDHLLDGTFDRQEFNATLGWGFTSDFSAYLGYKHAKLDLSQVMSPVQSPAPFNGDVLFYGTRRIDFTYHGFFIGATYSISVRSWGAISMQSSLARLNSSFKEGYAGNVDLCSDPNGTGCRLVPQDASFANNKAPVHGTSNGFNLGISWTAGLAWLSDRLQNLSYTIGLDRSQYEFDSGNQSNAALAANFQETNTRVRFDLRYRLNH